MRGLQVPAETLPPGSVALLGVPLDANSSFLRGAAGAPQAIRAALHSPSTNLCTESGIDLCRESRWCDVGDLEVADSEGAFATITDTVTTLLQRDVRVLSLGGDHSITLPILRAHGRVGRRPHVLHLDAHPDLYEDFEGNPHSHASPFARIMEEGLAARLVQVGIRTMNPHQRQQVERFGVEVVEMRHWHDDMDLGFDAPVYLSLDLDCLDPAFAPGVSHREPGGFSTRDVLRIIQGVRAPLVGADLVELNPAQDASGITARVAAKLLKEVAARLLD